MTLDALIPPAQQSESLGATLRAGWCFGGCSKRGRGWSLHFWRGEIGAVETCALAWRSAWRPPVPPESQCEAMSRAKGAAA